MRRDPERPYYEGRGDAASELDFHLEMLEERLRAQGLGPEEAAAEARRRFGDRREVLDRCRRLDRSLLRRERLSDWLADLGGDLRLSWRALRAAPGFAVTAVLTLALALGATTALFSLVHGVLLSPLGYRHADRLALLSSTNEPRGWTGMPLPPGVYRQLREGGRSLEAVAVFREQRYTLLSAHEPRRLEGAAISDELLAVVGVEPLLGRGFLPDDPAGHEGGPCLVSERLWRRDLGGRPAALGGRLRLEGDGPSCEVVGVLPRSFALPTPETDLWQLYRPAPGEDDWGAWFLTGVVRWSADAGLEGARAELAQRAAGWADELPFGVGWQFVLTPLRETVVGEVAPALWALFAAVALVLVVACVNLGGLLLARTAERSEELATRAALGASRSRLARQLLAENLVLCGLGGGLGTILAHLGVRVFRAAPPLDLPRLDAVGTNATVLAFALVTTVGSAVLATAAPAFQALRQGVGRTSRPRTVGRAGAARLRSVLVVVEASLAVALLAGAGLLARSFLTLTSVPPGFDVAATATMALELPPGRYGDDVARRRFFDGLLERLQGLPAVEAAGITTGLPLRGVAMIDRLAVEGDPTPPEERPTVAIDAVSPGYFQALGVPLLAGRVFDDRDHATGPRVAIVNEAIADRFFPGGSALGRRLVAGDDESALTIVGVVGAVKQYGLREETPLHYFVPFAQAPRGSAHLVFRTAGEPEAAAADVTAVARELDRSLPIAPATPFARALSASLDRDRFYALAMGGFAVTAAVLATLGLYGLVAYGVEQRRRELGLRMALGAGRGRLFRSVLRRALGLAVAGVVVGSGLGLLLAKGLVGILFGVAPSDPLAFAAGAVLVPLVALGASCLPAHRATEIDPASALRGG